MQGQFSKQRTIGLNSEFSFSYTGYLSKTNELRIFFYRRIDGDFDWDLNLDRIYICIYIYKINFLRQ